MFSLENSENPISLPNCPQETEAIQKVYDKLKNIGFPKEILQIHLRSTNDGKVGICYFAKRMTSEIRSISIKIKNEIKSVTGIAAAGYRDFYTIIGRDFIEQKIGNILYRIPLNAFFQTNYVQAEVLQKLVTNLISTKIPETILDLYCGTGFFALAAAQKSKKSTWCGKQFSGYSKCET